MTSWAAYKSLWNFQEFGRERNRLLDLLMNQRQVSFGSGGVYLIGCGHEIVYIGMTNDFRRRTLQSLGQCYPLVEDQTLPWSLALAPWGKHQGTECWEASAIKAFAPIYNTSIPSLKNSDGALPEIYKHVPIFADQVSETGGAFEVENMQQQKERTCLNPNPAWKGAKT
jgi:hypothetical protein